MTDRFFLASLKKKEKKIKHRKTAVEPDPGGAAESEEKSLEELCTFLRQPLSGTLHVVGASLLWFCWFLHTSSVVCNGIAKSVFVIVCFIGLQL